jgi:hypothetical protein
MIWDLQLYGIRSHVEHIEADTEIEAKEKAKVLMEEMKKEILNELSSSLTLSEKNHKYDVGAIYSCKTYKSSAPAKCISSQRYYTRYHRGGLLGSSNSGGEKSFTHVFHLLGTDKDIRVTGKKDEITRIGKKLCDDGKITDKCNSCLGSFVCFTRRAG